jgi:hypothetical protein
MRHTLRMSPTDPNVIGMMKVNLIIVETDSVRCGRWLGYSSSSENF